MYINKYNMTIDTCGFGYSSFEIGGKYCPEVGECLNSNEPITSLPVAIEKCNKKKYCGGIMKWNDNFLLRRSSDPPITDQNVLSNFDVEFCERQTSTSTEQSESTSREQSEICKNLEAVFLEAGGMSTHQLEVMPEASYNIIDNIYQNMINECIENMQNMKKEGFIENMNPYTAISIKSKIDTARLLKKIRESADNAVTTAREVKSYAEDAKKSELETEKKAKITSTQAQDGLVQQLSQRPFTNLNDCDIDNDNALYFNGKLNNSNNITKREFMNYLTGENNTKNNTKKTERIKNKNNNDKNDNIDEKYDLYSNVNKVGAILFFALCIILILKHKKYFK